MPKSDENKTYGEYRYTDVHPNPLNPRRIFDKYKLDVLEESIRANRILVPLTVYRSKKDDFIGTGKTVSDYWNQILSQYVYPDQPMYLGTAIAYVPGIDRIHNETP
jgi:hypothetical protein